MSTKSLPSSPAARNARGLSAAYSCGARELPLLSTVVEEAGGGCGQRGCLLLAASFAFRFIHSMLINLLTTDIMSTT